MGVKSVVTALAVPAVAAAMVLAAAPAQAKPEKGKTFGDWGIACEAQPDGKTEKCYAVQNQVQNEGGALVISVNAGYLGPKGEAMMVVLLPLGINLQAGAAYKIDEREQVSFKLAQCTPLGCQGIMPLDPQTITDMGKGKDMVFGVNPFGGDKSVNIKVSLKGFKDAFASLK